MANAVTVFNPSAAVPAYAKNREVSPLTKALTGGSNQTGKRIGLKGGVFHLISDGKEVASIEERYLDVVIVAAAPKISRTYYAGAYNPDKPEAPACWSADGNLPDPSSSQKQAASCATCPMNEKGSGQGESKACAYNQRVAVTLANDMEGDVMQLQLPSNSIFGKEENGNFPLQAYARFLAAQQTVVEANMMITRMKFDTSVSFPKLFFKPMRWLEPDEYDIAVKQGQTPDAQKAIQLTVAAMDGVVAAPKEETVKPAAPKAEEEPPAPPPKSKAAPAADDEPPAPEPTKRKSAAKEAPEVPGKAKLAEVLSKWDDEN